MVGGGGGDRLPGRIDGLVEIGQLAGALEAGAQADAKVVQAHCSVGVVGGGGGDRLPGRIDGLAEVGQLAGALLVAVPSGDSRHAHHLPVGDAPRRPPPSRVKHHLDSLLQASLRDNPVERRQQHRHDKGRN